MDNYQSFFDQLDIDASSATEFFIVFARFEYALKRSGFASGSEDKVAANWDQFGSRLKNDFDRNRTSQLQEAVNYLEYTPPLKQVLIDKQLSWRSNERNGESLLTWLLRLIRTVRNNLFHGGKFPEQPVTDPSRNRRLLQSSLVILFECLDLSEKLCLDVKDRFYDRIE